MGVDSGDRMRMSMKTPVEVIMAGVVIGVCGIILVGCSSYMLWRDLKNSILPPKFGGDDKEKDKDKDKEKDKEK